MDEVGIRELRNDASRIVERVERGETIVVTKRGRPVARLVPTGAPPGIAKMIAEGRATWNGGKPTPPINPIQTIGEGPLLSGMLLEDRR